MSIWFTEELHPYYRKGIRVKKILADEQTEFQHLQLVETEFFGNAMILDGIIQLTERDNMGYHEMIVHMPMLAVGVPKRVLIIGGGDGGSLQQVLRYPSVEEVAVCELDQRVVDLSREYFTASFGDPWSDPRSKLLIRDAFGYLEENPGTFDVIISDTTDPIGMAERLFSDDFYKLIVHALAPGGAYSDPADTALLVWRVEDTAVVENFVSNDPYVKNGLIARWEIRPWTVVIGTAYEK